MEKQRKRTSRHVTLRQEMECYPIMIRGTRTQHFLEEEKSNYTLRHLMFHVEFKSKSSILFCQFLSDFQENNVCLVDL